MECMEQKYEIITNKKYKIDTDCLILYTNRSSLQHLRIRNRKEQSSLKAHSHRAKVEIVFDVCRLFFDLFRFRSHFRLVSIGLKSYYKRRLTSVLQLGCVKRSCKIICFLQYVLLCNFTCEAVWYILRRNMGYSDLVSMLSM